MPLTNKTIWTASIFTIALMCVWDMSTRLNRQISVEEKVFAINEDVVANTSLFDAAQAAEISALYDGYDVIAKAPAKDPQAAQKPKKIGLSQAEQNNQQGNLDKFYIGEHTYILLGLFEDKERFAVLAQQNITTKLSKEIRVTLGYDLAPYKVTKINDSMVEFTLVSASKSIVLSLF